MQGVFGKGVTRLKTFKKGTKRKKIKNNYNDNYKVQSILIEDASVYTKNFSNFEKKTF